MDGGADDTIAVIERCRLARIALSLGGPETLLTHPATIAGRFTPAERAELGITDSLVRMSVGLEHVDDLHRRPHPSPQPPLTPTRHPATCVLQVSVTTNRQRTGSRRAIQTPQPVSV